MKIFFIKKIKIKIKIKFEMANIETFELFYIYDVYINSFGFLFKQKSNSNYDNLQNFISIINDI